VRRFFAALLASLALTFASANSHAEARPPFDSGELDYRLRIREDANPYRVFGVFVLPGETLPLEIEGHPRKREFRLQASAGRLEQPVLGQWQWQAPRASGRYSLQVLPPDGSEPMRLNVFVMVPAAEVKNGWLNGYRMGKYPQHPLKGLPIYLPPSGFIELQPQDVDAAVSPHFTVGQFLAKQKSGWPKYLVLRERLVLSLEVLLAEVNALGHRADSFFVMSGYRTPHYNAGLGNGRYSRHLWGGAADIFIDENPRDGVMDDLNRDGRINAGDSAWLYRLVDELHARPFYASFMGGLGKYRENSRRGPFVHVDVRGFKARWEQ
jgi:hypothetical protein